MSEFYPYFTNDGSVGLYNHAFDDIYHSATGALTEAYEKFIYPIDFDSLLSEDDIKVLDICYGIGYNSKGFLNFLFENYILKNNTKKFFSKKLFHANIHIDKIDADNILSKSIEKIDDDNTYNPINEKDLYMCIDKIDDNNIFRKISVTAVDNDKLLGFLSPFIKTGEKHIKNNKIPFYYEKIEKYLNKNFSKKVPKINKLINYLIFEKILDKYPEILSDAELENIITSKENRPYFDKDLKAIFGVYKNNYYKMYPFINKFLNLHNIYYKYLSKKYKNGLKTYSLSDINFDIVFDDVRKFILQDCNKYNLIFLDAFTPSKCPCLWSYDFFVQLYSHLKKGGIILTYSSSASVRNGMIAAGFYIGNIIDTVSGKIIGTICSNDKNQIKNPLSEFDLGLLNTRAGIFYRDENLTALNDQIEARRKLEVENSDKLSSSKYIKTYSNLKNLHSSK